MYGEVASVMRCAFPLSKCCQVLHNAVIGCEQLLLCDICGCVLTCFDAAAVLFSSVPAVM